MEKDHKIEKIKNFSTAISTQKFIKPHNNFYATR